MNDYILWKRTYITEESLHAYERWVARFRAFTKKPIKDLTIDDVQLFHSHLKRGGHSPKNIQFGLSVIRDYLSYHVSMGNVRLPIALIKVKNQRSNSHHAITREEYGAMCAVFNPITPLSIQRLLMLRLLWETGMRVSELLSLKISDLYHCEAIIHNRKNTRRRMIAWSTETQKLLQKYLQIRKKLESEDDHLFVSLTLRPHVKFTPRTVQRAVKIAAEKAGLTAKITVHGFRHGFTHTKLAEGKPMTVVAQMLGHSTILNVLTYHQMSDKELRTSWGLTS